MCSKVLIFLPRSSNVFDCRSVLKHSHQLFINYRSLNFLLEGNYTRQLDVFRVIDQVLFENVRFRQLNDPLDPRVF